MQQQPHLTIDRQYEQIKRRDYLIKQLWLLSATLFAIIIVLAVMLFMGIRAYADTVCLSKNEARHLWPRQHIYWYSKHHCWSNRRGPPRGLKFDPIFSSKTVATSRAEKLDEFNELDAMADKPPMWDIVEDSPFGPWEERVAGQFADGISK